MAERYARVIRLVSEHPWCVLPATLDVVVEILSLRADGIMFTDEEIRQRLGAAGPQRREARTESTVAVLPLHGVIAPRMNAMTQISGGTSAEAFGAVFSRVIDNPQVSAVIIDTDSPGGSVFGIEELAATIRSARGAKPIVAVASHMMASAAYWIGSQADEIIVSPSSMIGSIGCIAAHEDTSGAEVKLGLKTTYITAGKFKGESAPGLPLTDEARGAMQAHVDGYYNAFVNGVARGRGVKPQAVREGFGEGRMVQARDAVKLGMADGIGTLDQVIARLASGQRRVTGAAAATGGAIFANEADRQQFVKALGATVDQADDGTCPDGYEKGDDGQCHLMPAEKLQARAEQAELKKRLAAALA